MDTTELISSLGARLGIELVPDADGACAIEADVVAVSFTVLPEMSSIVLQGDLGMPPPERLEGLNRALLSANHLFSGTAGATFSLNPESGRVEACRSLDCRVLDEESFFAETESFVNVVEAWTRIVADYREGSAVGQDAAPSDEGDLPPLSGGFMQV